MLVGFFLPVNLVVWQAPTEKLGELMISRTSTEDLSSTDPDVGDVGGRYETVLVENDGEAVA